MTEREANRLLLMLQYNFAGFFPNDVQGIAVKKGMWTEELLKYDAQQAEKAVKAMIRTLHYPPQIADFREHIGVETRRQPLLNGPTYDTKEGVEAMYTADPEHVERVMAELMRDLA